MSSSSPERRAALEQELAKAPDRERSVERPEPSEAPLDVLRPQAERGVKIGDTLRWEDKDVPIVRVLDNEEGQLVCLDLGQGAKKWISGEELSDTIEASKAAQAADRHAEAAIKAVVAKRVSDPRKRRSIIQKLAPGQFVMRPELLEATKNGDAEKVLLETVEAQVERALEREEAPEAEMGREAELAMVADALQERGAKLRTLETRMRAGEDVFSEIHEIEPQQFEDAKRYGQLLAETYPDMNAERVFQQVEFLAGEDIIFPEDFKNISTAEDVRKRVEGIKAALTEVKNQQLPDRVFDLQNLLKRDVEVDEKLAAIMELDDDASEAFVEEMRKEAAKPASLRQSKYYLWARIENDWYPVAERIKKVDGNISFWESRGYDASKFIEPLRQLREDYVREIKEFQEVGEIVSPSAPDDITEDEMAENHPFFDESAKDEKLMAASAKLGLDISDVRGMESRLAATKAELTALFEAARTENPDAVEPIQSLLHDITYSYDELLDAPVQPPGRLKRLAAWFGGRPIKPQKTIGSLQDALVAAEAYVADSKRTRKDWDERARRTGEWQENQTVRATEPSARTIPRSRARQVEAAPTEEPALPRVEQGPVVAPPREHFPPRRGERAKRVEEKDFEIGRLPEAARSDAERNADVLEQYVSEIPDPIQAAGVRMDIETLRNEQFEYQRALPKFYARMDLAEQKRLASEAGEDVTDYETTSLANYRRVFEAQMRNLSKALNKNELRQRLDDAGIHSFDDIVRAATNKRLFDKRWNTYVSVAQDLAGGSVGSTRASRTVANEVA